MPLKRPLLIVAHGSPSEPAPQEVFVQALARRIGAHLPDLEVRGATLAADGALQQAGEGLENPLIVPWFVSDGWFVSTNLPRRLKAAGLRDWDMTIPMGMLPGLDGLALNRLRKGLSLVIAAHGSPSDPRPRAATQAFADRLAETGAFAEIRVGYVDEAPGIEEAARLDGPGIVLPFFAARAGHVLLDMPQALEKAGFKGKVLDPIGTWPETTDHVADWLRSGPVIFKNGG